MNNEGIVELVKDAVVSLNEALELARQQGLMVAADVILDDRDEEKVVVKLGLPL